MLQHHDLLLFMLLLQLCIQIRAIGGESSLFINRINGPPVDRSFILAKKILSTRNLHVGKEAIISYQLINIGSQPALDVKLMDEYGTKMNTSSKVIPGEPLLHIAELWPGTRVVWNISIIPRAIGQWKYATHRSTVHYSSDTHQKDFKTVSSAIDNGTGMLISLPPPEKDNHMKYDHVKEWTTFCVLACGPVVVPLAIWLTIRHDNEELLIPPKNKNS